MRWYFIRSRVGPNRSGPWRPPLSVLLLLSLAALLSLGSVIRVYAMPAEARLSETWYSYRQDMNYDFTARVKSGDIYAAPVVHAQDLLQMRLPVEPPITRRVLVSRLTDTITLQLPFTFQADRPGSIHATYAVDGVLTVPGLWQRPYPLLPARELIVEGDQLVLDKLAVEIPITQIVAELDRLTLDMKLSQDQAEIRVRPSVTIAVDGVQKPVNTALNEEIVVAIRGTSTAIEVDEPKVFSDEKQFTESKVLPATVSLFGYQAELATMRRLSITVLAVFALILAALLLVQWWRGGRAGRGDDDLKKLGPALITARGLDLPADVTAVQVRTIKQLIQIHLQTDRPVIRVGNSCYLLDGATCYRLELDASESA